MYTSLNTFYLLFDLKFFFYRKYECRAQEDSANQAQNKTEALRR